MAKNYVKEGDVLDLAAPYAVSSGDGAQVGSVFGVAVCDLANGATGPFARCGVFDLTALSTAVGAQGAKVYWDNANKRVDTDGTVGILIGVLEDAKANGDTTARVVLNEAVADMAEGPQPTIVALTDSTGLSGTHDDTLAATPALVTLTDSTGGSGTHDDTLADGLTVVAFVAGAFTGAVDGTVEDVAAAAGNCQGGATPTAAQVDTAIATAVATIVTGVNLQLAELKSKIDSLITDVTVQNQNDSDLAQKIIEIVAQLAVANQNTSDVAQKTLEIRTALINAGIIAAA